MPTYPLFFRRISLHFNTWPTFREFWFDASQWVLLTSMQVYFSSPEDRLAFSSCLMTEMSPLTDFFVGSVCMHRPKTDTKPHFSALCQLHDSHSSPMAAGLSKCLDDLLGQMIYEDGQTIWFFLFLITCVQTSWEECEQKTWVIIGNEGDEDVDDDDDNFDINKQKVRFIKRGTNTIQFLITSSPFSLSKTSTHSVLGHG